MHDYNPIHEEDCKWYFWDEVWCDRYGPFHTEEIAKAELKRYCELVLGYKNEPE